MIPKTALCYRIALCTSWAKWITCNAHGRIRIWENKPFLVASIGEWASHGRGLALLSVQAPTTYREQWQDTLTEIDRDEVKEQK